MNLGCLTLVGCWHSNNLFQNSCILSLWHCLLSFYFGATMESACFPTCQQYRDTFSDIISNNFHQLTYFDMKHFRVISQGEDLPVPILNYLYL